MKKWWKKVRKNRKRTNTSSYSDLEGEATSESGFEDSAEMGSSLGNTDSEEENNMHEAPEGIFDQYLDSCPSRGPQKYLSQ